MRRNLLVLLGVLVVSVLFADVSAIGTWGGSELEVFKAMCTSVGVKVNFETTRDLDALIATRIASKNLPDIAILPNPSMLKRLAAQGVLKPITYVSREELSQTMARTMYDLGSYGGKLYGVFVKIANKSVIWYNPEEFKKNGWSVPKTWKELVDLSAKMAKAGKTPWSIGADIGWPLSDWVENIMIRTAGPELYQQWIDHEISWTHPSVRKAFQTWGDIVGNPKYLLGGIDGTLATTFQNAAYAVFQTPPKAYLYYEGDFMAGIVKAQIPSANMDFFVFPSIDPKYGAPIVGGGDIIVVFNDTPEVQKLIKGLIDVKAQTVGAEGGFLVPNRKVPLTAFKDPVLRKSAEIVQQADIFVFDASDLMPPAVGNQGGFWDAAKKYIQNPKNLDKILQEMEALAKKNY
ncbi:ABC-type sugar transport system, periplasmic component UgpB [Brevinematales bacterium NS]|nr:ABC-type sugar transport system, periplasmic component UgpB [Brevinematales bacterium NS]